MSVLVNKNTKVNLSGFYRCTWNFHSEQAIKYGTNLVGGVTPKKGGQKHLDRPVFNSVAEAKDAVGADAYNDLCACKICCRSYYRGNRCIC